MPPSHLLRLAGLLSLCLITALFTGCSSHYVTPGGPADLTGITSSEMEDNFTLQPAARFPARLAVVQLQGSSYGRGGHHDEICYGEGAYRVVSSNVSQPERDPSAYLENCDAIAGFAILNRMVLPPNLKSAKDLRLAASKIHADLLLMYTLDTSFYVVDHEVGPLNTFSLGFLPNQEAKVSCSASCAILDVRTGYVYGLAEAQALDSNLATVWNSKDAVDKTRIEVESKALEKLWGQTEKLFTGIAKEQAKRTASAMR
jgi:hypothetical protein